MEIEYKAVALVNDANMQAEADRLAADGWQTRPDVAPVTIYHLVRIRAGKQPAVSPFGEGKLVIDDDKVLIRSGVDGKLRKADGTIVSEN